MNKKLYLRLVRGLFFGVIVLLSLLFIDFSWRASLAAMLIPVVLFSVDIFAKYAAIFSVLIFVFAAGSGIYHEASNKPAVNEFVKSTDLNSVKDGVAAQVDKLIK